MTGRYKNSLKYLFSIVLTFGLLYIAFRSVDGERLAAAMRSANYLWLLVMFLLLMISHSLRSWRWRYFLDPIKPRVGFRNLFSAVMVGYVVNNVLPRAGELVRPYTLGRLESIPKSAALGTIVVERIMDAISILLLLVLIPLVYDGPLRETFPWLKKAGIILSVVMTAFVVVAVVLMMNREIATKLVGVFQHVISERLHLRVHGMVHSFLDGFLFLKRPDNFLIIFFLSVGVWLLYVAMMYAAFFAFHIEETLGWRGAIVILAISSIGVAMPTPGSTGSYHVFTSQALTGLFFVPPDVALGYATLTHAVGYVGVSLVGLFFFLHDHVKLSEAITNETESRA